MTLGTAPLKSEGPKPAAAKAVANEADRMNQRAAYAPQFVHPAAVAPHSAAYPMAATSMYGMAGAYGAPVPMALYGGYPYAPPAMAPFVGAPAPHLAAPAAAVEDDAEDPDDLWFKDPWGEAEAAKRKLESEKKLKAMGAGLQRKPKSGIFSKALLDGVPEAAASASKPKHGKKAASVKAKASRVASIGGVTAATVKAKRKSTDSSPKKKDSKNVASVSPQTSASPNKRAKLQPVAPKPQPAPTSSMAAHQMQLMQYQLFMTQQAQFGGYSGSCGADARFRHFSAYNGLSLLPPTIQPAHQGLAPGRRSGKESILLQAARATTKQSSTARGISA